LKRMEAFAQDVDVDANKLSSSATRAINANKELITNAQEVQDAQQSSSAKLSSISNRNPMNVKAQAVTASPEIAVKDVETQLRERAAALHAKSQHEKQLAEIRASQEAKYRQYAQAHSYQNRLEPGAVKAEPAASNKSSFETASSQDKIIPIANVATAAAQSTDELSRIREIQSAKYQETKTKHAAEKLQSTIVYPSSQELDSQYDATVRSGMDALSQADLDQSLSDTAAQRAAISYELEQHDNAMDKKQSDLSMESSIAQTLTRGIFEACRHNKMSVRFPMHCCLICPQQFPSHFHVSCSH
jgi:hypothetical protein